MATLLRDTSQALVSYFGTALSPTPVKLGFRDERAETEADRTYPEVTIVLYDAAFDALRRYAGVLEQPETHPTNPDTMINLVKNPIPVRLYFQLDTWSLKRDDDWSLQEKLMATLGSRSAKTTTTDGAVIYLMPEGLENLDDLQADNVWRKAYRFSVERWLRHPDAAVATYKVLTRIFEINGQTRRIEAA